MMEWIAPQQQLQPQQPQQELLVQIGQRSRIDFYFISCKAKHYFQLCVILSSHMQGQIYLFYS
jgi:hypothetical protein